MDGAVGCVEHVVGVVGHSCLGKPVGECCRVDKFMSVHDRQVGDVVGTTEMCDVGVDYLMSVAEGFSSGGFVEVDDSVECERTLGVSFHVCGLSVELAVVDPIVVGVAHAEVFSGGCAYGREVVGTEAYVGWVVDDFYQVGVALLPSFGYGESAVGGCVVGNDELYAEVAFLMNDACDGFFDESFLIVGDHHYAYQWELAHGINNIES